MINRNHHRQISLYAIAVACALSACSSTPEKEGDKTGWGSVSLWGLKAPSTEAPQYMEPTMDNLMGKAQPFPAKYPVEQYPDSKVILAEVRPVYTARRPNIVVLSTNHNIGQVAYYYKQRLMSQGWKYESADENSAYSSTVWTKGNQQAEVRVCPAPQEGEQIIQVLISPAPAQPKK